MPSRLETLAISLEREVGHGREMEPMCTLNIDRLEFPPLTGIDTLVREYDVLLQLGEQSDLVENPLRIKSSRMLTRNSLREATESESF